MKIRKLYCAICGFCRYYKHDAMPVICPDCGANDGLYIDNELVAQGVR
jgi:hypothetical protein